jgi:hypothetical protein
LIPTVLSSRTRFVWTACANARPVSTKAAAKASA